MRLAKNTGRKNDAKIAIWTTSYNFVGLNLRNVSTIGKKLLKHVLTICELRHARLLAAKIVSLVWETLQISMSFVSWLLYARHSSNGRQPNFAALNTGRHPYSAGRPSRWALAHISSILFFYYYSVSAFCGEKTCS